MSDVIHLTTPLDQETVSRLKIGERVLLSGTIYTARDAGHKRLVDLLDRGEKLPIPLEGQVIFYVGPTPPPPGRPIGAAGPTTSYRMDAYAPRLMAEGLKGMIGKGTRNEAVKQAMVEHGAIYFAAIGGAGALISRCITSAEVVAWPELGPEAVRRLEVKDLPLFVAGDTRGGDLYEEGIAAWRR